MVESTFNLSNLSNLSNINVSKILKSYLRVLKLTKKPSREEFLMIAKVAGAGIILIGFVGFTIYVLLTEVPKWM